MKSWINGFVIFRLLEPDLPGLLHTASVSRQTALPPCAVDLTSIAKERTQMRLSECYPFICTLLSLLAECYFTFSI